MWVGADAELAAASAKAAGLSLVEIPLTDPTQLDRNAAVETLHRHNLEPTCSLGLPAYAHAPDHPDEAIAFLGEAIDTAAAIGSSWLTGALYGHLGHLTGSGPTSTELDTVASVLQTAADHADTRGVRLGVEVINRYETYLVNTAEQVLELMDRINRPGTVFAHLDTFHMNIEEPDIAHAVRLLGERLGYVHLAESNRGDIGSGIFPFDELFDALTEINFQGPAVIEAFNNASAELLRATASWRAVASEPASFIDRSVTHLRNILDTCRRSGNSEQRRT